MNTRLNMWKECWKVHFPSTLVSIGQSAFSGMTSLTSIELPDGVSSIGTYAFNNTGLTSVALPESLASIPEGCFKDCASLGEVILPPGLTAIGSYAFEDCTALTGLPAIPDGASAEIGPYAFRGCTGITELVIPSAVTVLRNYAFQNCTGMEKLTLPESLANIPDYCFNNCANLEEIYVSRSSSLSSVGSNAFSGCPGTLTFFGYSDSWVESYANGAGFNFVALDTDWTAEMILPAGLITIEEEAFINNTFRTVQIQEGTQSIGARAFGGCRNLRRVIIPESVNEIADNTFSGTRCLVVYCEAGSYAQQYAEEHGFLIVEK